MVEAEEEKAQTARAREASTADALLRDGKLALSLQMAGGRAAEAINRSDQLAQRLQMAEARATEAVNQSSLLAARLLTAEAEAADAKKQNDLLALRLQTAEGRLRERADYTTFLENHISCSGPHTTSPRSASTYALPGPFIPFERASLD